MSKQSSTKRKLKTTNNSSTIITTITDEISIGKRLKLQLTERNKILNQDKSQVWNGILTKYKDLINVNVSSGCFQLTCPYDVCIGIETWFTYTENTREILSSYLNTKKTIDKLGNRAIVFSWIDGKEFPLDTHVRKLYDESMKYKQDANKEVLKRVMLYCEKQIESMTNSFNDACPVLIQDLINSLGDYQTYMLTGNDDPQFKYIQDEFIKLLLENDMNWTEVTNRFVGKNERQYRIEFV